MSIYDNYKKDSCDKKKDCIPNKIIIECKNLSGTGTLQPPVSGMNPTPKTLGSISVDLKCFCKPCVKLDVNTIVEYDDTNFTTAGITLTFRVFKICDDESEEREIKTFQYLIGIGSVLFNKIESYNFTICDCDICPKCCCTYRVEVESTSDIPFVAGFAVARILDGTIKAIAFEDRC